MDSKELVFEFWGKSDRNTPTRTHPLLAHSADVAAVMEALLNLPVYQKIFATTAGRKLDEATAGRFSVCAGLHDVGKTTTGFQAKNKSRIHTNGHIRPMGALCDSGFHKKFFQIFPWLIQWGDTVFDFLTCMCGHHGSFPMVIEEAANNHSIANQCANLWSTNLPSGLSPFDGLASLAEHLQIWFPQAFHAEAPALPEFRPVQHLFTGLLMMADWIGSDEKFFPYASSNFNPTDYIQHARERASDALQTMRLDTSRIRSSVRFPTTFYEQFQMNPLPTQNLFEMIPLSPGGSLVIVEAETGSGKTECALRHFIRLFKASAVDSLYFANPLRFAATQLQKRVSFQMGKIFGEREMPTVLAVPGYVVVDDREGIRLPEYSVQWPDDEDPRRNWAAEHPKRYLCAPCAVGTIDQVLLSVLKAPHSHLRAAALCRSLLVIDEVHASDSFMTRITESLVELFALCGGHILLMSATLGGAIRERYLRIFTTKKQSIHALPPDLNSCVNTPYPLISTTTSPGRLIPSSGGKTKSVSITLHPFMTSPEAFVSLALDSARQGACVLVLRNSVSAAVKTLKTLENQCGNTPQSLLFSVNGVPTLHHARFAPNDRRLLDIEVEAFFGKEGKKRRPSIIVTTQTLEQSLDVDFDLLITDLSPADVLLQRIGRLFRHDRPRPLAFQNPHCYILLPGNDKNWLLSPEARRYQFGRERAYEDIRSIAATWMLLEKIVSEDSVLHIPPMNRLFVEHATHPEALSKLAKSLGPEWEQVTVNIMGTKGAKRQQATYDIISWKNEYSAGNVSAVDDHAVVTRLGLNDAVVNFASPLPGPFGVPVDKITIPGWMLLGKDLSELDSSIVAESIEGGIIFSACGGIFRYDRYGLERR